MTERTRKKIVYMIFVAAVIYGALNFLGPRKSTHLADSGEVKMATIQPAETTGMKNKTIADKSEWGRDPFARSVKATKVAARVETMRLTAISGSEDRPLALIDGKAVGIGESIAGWQVTNITRRSVQLQRNGEGKTLTIGGN